MKVRREICDVKLGYSEKGKRKLTLKCQTNETIVKLEDRYVICYDDIKWPFNVVEIEVSGYDTMIITLEEAENWENCLFEERLADKNDLNLRKIFYSEIY